MSNIGLMPRRPPYVRFEQRAEEDRNASIKAGGIVMKDVDYAVIMQPGSKDTYEPIAAEWMENIRAQARIGNYPQDWVDHFQRAYDAYKAGQDAPTRGLSVRQWPSLSKAQAENLISIGIICVEDVAEMTEAAMQRVGIGARDMKNKARAYMESRDQNKPAEQIAALQADLANCQHTIESLQRRLDRAEGRTVENEDAGAVDAAEAVEQAAPASPRGGRRRA